MRRRILLKSIDSISKLLKTAVQRLGTTFLGEDGKYYQTDIIGHRYGITRFGGRGVFDGSRAVSFSDLTGVTIVSYEGTSTPTISGNTINFTSGYLDYLELSNGSKYYFENFDNETLFDISDNLLHGTLSAGSAISWQTQVKGVFSYWDNHGGNYVAPNYIPALESNTKVDILGNENTNQGRVKYSNELWSSCLKSNGIEQYIDTGYIPTGETIMVVRGKVQGLTSAAEIMGCSDVLNSRYYFGVSNRQWLNGYGGVSGYGNRAGTADEEIHVFIKCGGDLWVLPVNSDISTGDSIKDLMINNVPVISYTSAFAQDALPIYLGSVNTNGNPDQFLEFVHNEVLICEGTCATEVSIVRKYQFSEYGGDTIHDVITGDQGTMYGSLIDAWDLSPYSYPRNNSNGFGIGIDHFVPASANDPTKDVNGVALTVLGTEQGLNGSESEYLTPYVHELIQACASLSPNFVFDSGESTLWGYDDIESNVQDLDFMFSDVNTNAPVKDKLMIFPAALDGGDLTKILEYINA